MCWNCSHTTEHHLLHQFPLKAEHSLQRPGWCEPVNPAETLCVIFGQKKINFSLARLSKCCSSYCRRCDGRRDKQLWLWISLVSSHPWACRCWFTGSDHTEVTERNRLPSLLFTLILLHFSILCSPCWSNAWGHMNISSLCKHTSSRYANSIIMRDNKSLEWLCVFVHRNKDVFGLPLWLVCSPVLYYSVSSGLLNLNNHAKTQWAKIPNKVLCNIVLAVCTARRLLINWLTPELSLVRLSQGWEQ